MDAHPNRTLMANFFAALAHGDRQPFTNAMSEDFSWTITGHGPWARTWRGKAAVRSGLLAHRFEVLEHVPQSRHENRLRWRHRRRGVPR